MNAWEDGQMKSARPPLNNISKVVCVGGGGGGARVSHIN